MCWTLCSRYRLDYRQNGDVRLGQRGSQLREGPGSGSGGGMLIFKNGGAGGLGGLPPSRLTGPGR